MQSRNVVWVHVCSHVNVCTADTLANQNFAARTVQIPITENTAKTQTHLRRPTQDIHEKVNAETSLQEKFKAEGGLNPSFLNRSQIELPQSPATGGSAMQHRKGIHVIS